MKMRDLTPSNDMSPEDARSICQYLTASKIRFRRKFHEDYNGVDYMVNGLEIAQKVINEMTTHNFIGPRFNFRIDGSEGKFSAFVKDEDSFYDQDDE